MTDIITTADKLACAERELKMRLRVYPRWQEAGRISAGRAAHEIACMESIIADYKNVVKKDQRYAKMTGNDATLDAQAEAIRHATRQAAAKETLF